MIVEKKASNIYIKEVINRIKYCIYILRKIKKLLFFNLYCYNVKLFSHRPCNTFSNIIYFERIKNIKFKF